MSLSAKIQQFVSLLGQELLWPASRLHWRNKGWSKQGATWQSLRVIARNDGFKQSKKKKAGTFYLDKFPIEINKNYRM